MSSAATDTLVALTHHIIASHFFPTGDNFSHNFGRRLVLHHAYAAATAHVCADLPPTLSMLAGWLGTGLVSSYWGYPRAPSAHRGQPPLLPQPPQRPPAAMRRLLLLPLLLRTAGRCLGRPSREAAC
jgi:hypothetical protein